MSRGYPYTEDCPVCAGNRGEVRDCWSYEHGHYQTCDVACTYCGGTGEVEIEMPADDEAQLSESWQWPADSTEELAERLQRASGEIKKRIGET